MELNSLLQEMGLVDAFSTTLGQENQSENNCSGGCSASCDPGCSSSCTPGCSTGAKT